MSGANDIFEQLLFLALHTWRSAPWSPRLPAMLQWVLMRLSS